MEARYFVQVWGYVYEHISRKPWSRKDMIAQINKPLSSRSAAYILRRVIHSTSCSHPLVECLIMDCNVRSDDVELFKQMILDKAPVHIVCRMAEVIHDTPHLRRFVAEYRDRYGVLLTEVWGFKRRKVDEFYFHDKGCEFVVESELTEILREIVDRLCPDLYTELWRYIE